MKRVRIQSFSGPHFPALELNMERYSGPNLGKLGLTVKLYYLKHTVHYYKYPDWH